MFSWINKLAPALVACLVVACSGPSDANSDAQGLRATVTFDPQPHIGTVECTVALTNASGAPAKCTEVELEGNMNHAGMVPVFARAEPQGEGSFVAPIEFTMGGDWLIFVRGKSEGGHDFEIVVDVPGVQRQPKSDDAGLNAGQ